jgi:hypothetical protein
VREWIDGERKNKGNVRSQRPRDWLLGLAGAPWRPSVPPYWSPTGPSHHPTEGRSGQRGIDGRENTAEINVRCQRPRYWPLGPGGAPLRPSPHSYWPISGPSSHPIEGRISQRGIDGQTHLRNVYLVYGLDIGPSVQQEVHGVRLPIDTGQHQSRHTIL